jgi:tetratricopeptide (TPR) repeat protein
MRGVAMRFVLALLVMTATAGSALAKDKTWVGKTILVKKAGVKISQTGDDSKQVYVGMLDLIDYRVLAEDKGKIKVKAASGKVGWFDKSDAVLLDDAVAFFTERIRQNPKDDAAFNSRAIAWQLKGEIDSAIKDFDDAIRLEPNDPEHYNNRGNLRNAKKEYDKAIADFNEAIRLDPKHIYSYIGRGSAWRAKKEYDNAIADYDEVIRLDPNHPYSYNNRGNVWKAKKEYDKAIADFNEAIRLDPNFTFAYVNRGNTWSAKKEFDKAIDDYNKAIRLDPKDAYAYNGRGLVWFLKKKYDKAAKDFDDSEKLDGENPWVFMNRARFLATCAEPKFRDGKRAVEQAKKGLELVNNPTPEFHEALAAAYAEAGNFKEAVRCQERALEDPQLKNDSDARQRLELYRKKQPYRQD